MKLLFTKTHSSLMEYFVIIGITSLILQVTSFLLIIGGYSYKQNKKFRAHGFFMFTALIFHLITVFAVMLPSFFLAIIPILATESFGVNSVLPPIHAITGITAAILGAFIIGSWRFSESLKYCAPKKKLMRYTITTWLIALITGFIMFFIFYWTYLFG